jgi:hypothetical protein
VFVSVSRNRQEISQEKGEDESYGLEEKHELNG